jgi:hypothetical protein
MRSIQLYLGQFHAKLTQVYNNALRRIDRRIDRHRVRGEYSICRCDFSRTLMFD